MNHTYKESWFYSRGRLRGLFATIRGRESLPPEIFPQSHGRLLTITWLFDGHLNTRLPTGKEMTEMGDWEELLIPALEEEWLCVLFAVVTHANRRKWLLYCRDIARAQETVFRTIGRSGEWPLELTSELDDQWNTYRDIKRDCKILSGEQPDN